MHNEFELVGYEGIVGNELFFVGEFPVSGRQLELVVDGTLLLLIEFPQLNLGTAGLVKDTFLGDVFRLGTFEGNLDLETTHNLTVILTGLGYLTIVEQFGEVLLGSATKPHTVVTHFVQSGDDFLKLQQQPTTSVDKLTYLINQEEKVKLLEVQMLSKYGITRLRKKKKPML